MASDTTIPSQARCASPPAENSQWVVNFGGIATRQGSETPVPASASAQAPVLLYKITGGLVVPLYIIVLALIGSAISMTRRVPEYQRRAMSVQDPLSNSEAREKLVFQMMQVISAPLIAVTAFAIVKPASISEAVVVGFGSGFASEPILLMIRGLVEKISPAPSAPASAVAVKVTPSTSTPKPGETFALIAQVTGAPNTTVTWHLDPTDPSSGTITSAGIYTAPQSVAAERDVTVTATSTADRNQLGTAVIKLAPPPIALATSSVSVTMKPNEKRRFTATLPGAPAAGVTWTLEPNTAASGTLDKGDYKAPATAPGSPVTIAATTANGAIVSASVTIAV